VSDIWYYGDGEKSVGPLSLADLTKTLSRVANAKDVLVWRDGFEQWQKADTVPELVAFLFKPRQPVYELELENTIRRLIALLDAAREGSAEHRMILRQLAGVRDSSQLGWPDHGRTRNGGGGQRSLN
jgi:hypothetical protein